jgi:hypothetical protein
VWPFNRKAQTPAPSGPQPVPAPVIRRDWAGLPPIQRSIGEHPLTAPSDRFSDDLVTHQDPSVSSDRMGHQLSAEAPPGLVLALVTPTTRSDGPAMIPRPRVQRRVDGAVAESGEWDGDEAAPLEARSSPIPASVQRNAIVERPVVTPVVDQPLLTALAPDVDPVPVVSQPRRATAPLTFEASAASRSDTSDLAVNQPAAPRLTLGQVRRLGLGAPINQVPDRSVQRSASEPTPSPSLPAAVEAITGPLPAPTAAAQSLALPLAPGRSSSDAFGEPTSADRKRTSLPAVPESPGRVLSTVEPSRMSDAAPPADDKGTSSSGFPEPPGRVLSTVEPSRISGATSPAVQRVPDAAMQPSPEMGTVAVPKPPESASDFRAQLLSTLPLRPRLVTDAPPATPATARMPVTVPMATAAQTATPAAPVVLPIAPLAGVRPMATLQRSADRAALGGDGRGAQATAESMADDDDLDLFVRDKSRYDDGGSYAGDQPQSASPLPIQRVLAATVDEKPIASLALAPRPRAALAGRAEEPATAGAAAAMDFPLAPAPVIVQRIAVDESANRTAWANIAEGSSLQRAPAEVAAVAEAPGALPAGPAGAASPNGLGFHPAAGSHAPEADLDALAGRLYDRIRSRLKTELLVDRERAGFLTDLR